MWARRKVIEVGMRKAEVGKMVEVGIGNSASGPEGSTPRRESGKLKKIAERVGQSVRKR